MIAEGRPRVAEDCFPQRVERGQFPRLLIAGPSETSVLTTIGPAASPRLPKPIAKLDRQWAAIMALCSSWDFATPTDRLLAVVAALGRLPDLPRA
jgi:hypothetical protein